MRGRSSSRNQRLASERPSQEVGHELDQLPQGAVTVVHPLTVSAVEQMELAGLAREVVETTGLVGRIQVVPRPVGDEERARREPADEVLDGEAKKPLARLARDREAEAGVLVELRLHVAQRRALQSDEIERGYQGRASVHDTLQAILLESGRQLRPRVFVVESPCGAVPVGERDDRCDALVVCRFGDHQSPAEPPAEQREWMGGGIVAAVQVVDRGANVFDLLLRDEASALSVAEAEAAVVEAETCIPVRDERACEAGRLEALEAEVARAGDHDTRPHCRLRVPELAVEPPSVAEEPDRFRGAHAVACSATAAPLRVPPSRRESSDATSTRRDPAAASRFSARNFGPERLSAATTRPSKSRTGAAIATRPASNSSST